MQSTSKPGPNLLLTFTTYVQGKEISTNTYHTIAVSLLPKSSRRFGLPPLRPLNLPHELDVLVDPPFRVDTSAQRHDSDLEENLELRGEAPVDAGCRRQ